ncbi:LysM domain-containing protein [Fructobacillus tropaeoli]|uniref:LysM domain-containing protein n=1 Tax=Fructobacillus tropaeoli TaxID=709323 RepID=A0ABM9N283_9LACO|nr:unnamed protein product [Fructobacillus tropaeoli]
MSKKKKTVLVVTSVIALLAISAGTIVSRYHTQLHYKQQKSKKLNKQSSSVKTKEKSSDWKQLDDYIVVNGDTPSSIASHFKVKLDDLLKKYQLTKDQTLVPGKKLNEQHSSNVQSTSNDTSQPTSSDSNQTAVPSPSNQSSANTSTNTNTTYSSPAAQAPAASSSSVATQTAPSTPSAPASSAPAQTAPAPAQTTPSQGPTNPSKYDDGTTPVTRMPTMDEAVHQIIGM